jgi:hypothetical protein
MSMHRLHVRRLASAIMVLAIGGCADKTAPVDTLPRREVSGTVSLDGNLLKEGKITFAPAENDKAIGPAVTGDIKEGKFSIDRTQGPTPGKYKVIISGLPAMEIKSDEMPGSAPKRLPEPVPAKYNSKTTLTKDVSGDATNQFDFPLTSK